MSVGGFVYVMHWGGEADRVKVGSSAFPADRAKSLTRQLDRELVVSAAVECPGLYRRSVEARAQDELRSLGAHVTGEWFRATPAQALWAIYRSVRFHREQASREWFDLRRTDKWSLPLLRGLPRVPKATRHECFL